jgi:zinc transporter ZupT
MQGKTDAASRAFFGLLVHSAADGFAVGASSVSSSASLSFLVAVAMVLHKARSAANVVVLRPCCSACAQFPQDLC